MTNNQVRHVPVLDDGRLVGIVGIGDVVKNRMDELQAEHEHLQAYITQGRVNCAGRVRIVGIDCEPRAASGGKPRH